MAKKKVVKSNSRKKHLYPFIQDPNLSESKLILHDKDQLLDYIRDRVLDVMDDRAQEETYVIGFVAMTDKQMENLKDIE